MPTYRTPPRDARRLGARPAPTAGAPRVVRSLHLQPEDLEAHNRHLQAKYADDRRARGPLGGRAARRRRDRDRRLRHGGARRADRHRAGPRARPAAGLFRPITPVAVPVRGAGDRRVAAPGHRRRRAVGRADGRGRPAGRRGPDAGLLPRPDRRHGPDAGRGRRRAPARLGDDREPVAGGTMTTSRPDAVERARHDAGAIYRRPDARWPTGSTHYCPGCGHGIIHRLVAELLDEMAARPDGRSASPRSAAASSPTTTSTSTSSSRPTAGPGGRDRRPARPPGRVRLHLPGRRRPGRDRHGRDRPRRRARRADQRHLRQQRHLRHDRRPDGADDAPRPADDLEPDRPRRADRPATRSRSPRCWRCCPACRTRRAARSPIRARSGGRRRCCDARSRSSWPAAACRSSRSCRPARSAGA